MNIEDRLREAARARAGLVRPPRPLGLPDGLPDRAVRLPARRGLRPRRRSGVWLVPLAAATAVTVLAALLVVIRDLPVTGHAPASVPDGHSSGPARVGPGRVVPGLPRYGVVFIPTTVKIPPKWGSTDVEVSDLSVVDTQTGTQLALVRPPADMSFMGVSGAADDRTFAVTASYYVPTPLPGDPGDQEDIQVVYLLRIHPGSAHPATLTRLPIAAQPSAVFIYGLALSPDGRTLAVLAWSEHKAPGSIVLRLYSVATGQPVRTWTGGSPPRSVPGGYETWDGLNQNYAGLTWLADGRTLAFTLYAPGRAPAVRTLDTSRPGSDLVAGSRLVFTLPTSGPDPCNEAQLTPDGATVVCGTQQSSVQGACANAKQAEALEIDAYSAATGKRERVLYRAGGKCSPGGIGALGWVGSANTVIVTVNQRPWYMFGSNAATVSVGVLTGGRLIPLFTDLAPGQGLGTIAF